MDWVVASELIYIPVLFICFLILITGDEDAGDFKSQINLASFGILLRALRVTSILNEITLWRNFVRTLRALIKPFFNFGATLYSLYLIYASIGLEFFGGLINMVQV